MPRTPIHGKATPLLLGAHPLGGDWSPRNAWRQLNVWSKLRESASIGRGRRNKHEAVGSRPFSGFYECWPGGGRDGRGPGQACPLYAKLCRIGEYFTPGPMWSESRILNDNTGEHYETQEVYRALCEKHGFNPEVGE